MSKRKFTDDQELQICNDYFSEEKPSIVILAKKWDCVPSTIFSVLKRNGYNLRSLKGLKRSEDVKRKFSDIKKIFTKTQEVEICAKYFLETKPSVNVLAKEYNCSNDAIRNAIIRNGYSLRTISEANKGQASWNKDLTKETDERVKSIGDSNKGKKAWNKNLTKETDERVAKGSHPQSEATKKKIGNALRDKPKSEETKRKLREKALLRVQTQHGPFKNTKPELKMKKILNELNIPFEHQFVLNNCSFDFRILNTNILIEVDGDYYHGNPKKFIKLNKMQLKMKERDKKHNEIAKFHNYILLRFWEEDILNNMEEVKNIISKNIILI